MAISQVPISTDVPLRVPCHVACMEDQAHLGSMWPRQTGRSIPTKSGQMAKRANAKTVQPNASHVVKHVSPGRKAPNSSKML